MRIKPVPAVFYFLLLVSVWLASGCAGSTAPDQADSVSKEFLPTWIAETVSAGALQTEQVLNQTSQTPNLIQPSETPSPTRAATATLSAMGPSPTPSITPTPTNTPLPTQPTRTTAPQPTPTIPAAAVQIRRPGPLSRLVSPLHLQANLRPGLDGRVRIELFGEDGRLLVRKIINYGRNSGWVYIDDDFEFEISAVAETGRLVISTYDDFERLAWLASEDVILLSLGENDINPSASDLEAVIIEEPLPNKLIQGGTLLLNGLSHLPDDQPLLIELITSSGKVVGYRQAFIQLDPDGGYSPFSAEIPYTVDNPTWVRLTIKQNSTNRIPGLVYAISFEVLLSP